MASTTLKWHYVGGEDGSKDAARTPVTPWCVTRWDVLLTVARVAAGQELPAGGVQRAAALAA